MVNERKTACKKKEKKEVICLDYQKQCVCRHDQFLKLPVSIKSIYETMTFRVRVCKKCGTLKMGYGYYDQDKNKYTLSPQKPKNKGEDVNVNKSR